ncbi:MAG: leucine-rich repeat protein [Clostridia bacterium]|nr:leucine-rich repeat protein [Clostridia bacterium]
MAKTTNEYKKGTANRVLVLVVVVLLTCLIAAIAYAAFANKGYLASRDRLDEAKTLYDAALTDLTSKADTAKTSYTEAEAVYTEARLTANAAETEYSNCLAALSEAEDAYEQARQALSVAGTSTEEAQADFLVASGALAEARETLLQAETHYNEAVTDLAAATTAFDEAQTAYEQASGALDLAVSNYGLAVSDYQAAIDLINSFIDSGGAETNIPSANEIYELTIDSIVEIRAYDVHNIYFKLGSGFFISEDGRVATNYHVIQNAFRLEVFHNDGNFYEVTSVLGYDAEIDLAVIQIDKNDCSPLTIATESPEVGDTVYAAGSNLGLTRTFTKGIVSYVDREIEGFEANSYIHYVGITHSGNSGGPILNADGEVIGVHQLGDSQTGDNGLAIPIAQLDMFAKDKTETPTETTFNNGKLLTADDLYYSVGFDNKVTITGLKTLLEDAVIRIPSQIDGLNVENLDWGNNSANLYYVEHIVVSEGIKRIGDYAFSSSYYLMSVSLPSTLEQLSQTAFSEATELYKIFLEGSAHFTLTDEVLYDNAHTILYKYPLCKSDAENPSYTEYYTVPSGVTTICDYAVFYAVGLQTLELPASLRHIGMMGISYCLNLTAVNLPQGLETIGVGGLSTNISLTSLTVPASVMTLGEHLDDGSGYIYKGPFFQCESLQSVTFAAGSQLSSMGDSVFGYCLDLTSAAGLRGATSVGNATFLNCISLPSIDLSALAVSDIGASAFKGCGALATVTLPQSLTVIAEGSFYDCYSLLTIALPTQVSSIGTDAFYGASNLTSATLPAGLTSIGEGAFYYCTSLSSINLQDTAVNLMGAYAFCGSGLTGVTLPATLETVPEYAFAACPELTSITLSSSTLWLKTGAFRDCSNLVTIDATACAYPPHLSDAGVFENSSAALTVLAPLAKQLYFQYDSAWMVYRNHIQYV